jgi:hypothetical protein
MGGTEGERQGSEAERGERLSKEDIRPASSTAVFAYDLLQGTDRHFVSTLIKAADASNIQ